MSVGKDLRAGRVRMSGVTAGVVDDRTVTAAIYRAVARQECHGSSVARLAEVFRSPLRLRSFSSSGSQNAPSKSIAKSMPQCIDRTNLWAFPGWADLESAVSMG